MKFVKLSLHFPLCNISRQTQAYIEYLKSHHGI